MAQVTLFSSHTQRQYKVYMSPGIDAAAVVDRLFNKCELSIHVQSEKVKEKETQNEWRACPQ